MLCVKTIKAFAEKLMLLLFFLFINDSIFYYKSQLVREIYLQKAGKVRNQTNSIKHLIEKIAQSVYNVVTAIL